MVSRLFIILYSFAFCLKFFFREPLYTVEPWVAVEFFPAITGTRDGAYFFVAVSSLICSRALFYTVIIHISYKPGVLVSVNEIK